MTSTLCTDFGMKLTWALISSYNAYSKCDKTMGCLNRGTNGLYTCRCSKWLRLGQRDVSQAWGSAWHFRSPICHCSDIPRLLWLTTQDWQLDIIGWHCYVGLLKSYHEIVHKSVNIDFVTLHLCGPPTCLRERTSGCKVARSSGMPHFAWNV